MLLDRIPPEAELQTDLDVGTPLSMELPSTLEVIAGEASPAAGRLRGLAAGGTDGGLCDADLGSDMADRHARAGQIDDLLLLRRADRAAGHVADAAGFRDLAVLLDRRYAGRARFRSHLTRHEALAEGEQGYPVVWIDTAQGHSLNKRGRPRTLPDDQQHRRALTRRHQSCGPAEKLMRHAGPTEFARHLKTVAS